MTFSIRHPSLSASAVQAWLVVVAGLMLIALSQVIVAKESFLYGDNFGIFLGVQSITEDFDFDLANQIQQRNLPKEEYFALGQGGELYSVHEKLLAVMGVPFYLLCGEKGLLILNILLGITFFCSFFSISLSLFGKAPALVGALAAALSGRLFYGFSNDLLGATVLGLGIAAGFHRKMFLSGLLLGALPLARLPLVPVGIFLGCCLIKEAHWKERGRIILGVAPGAILFLVTNWIMFADPLTVSYHRWIEFAGPPQIVRSQTEAKLTGDVLSNFVLMLTTPGSGLLDRSPLLPMVLYLGMSPLIRKSRAMAQLLVGAALVTILWFTHHNCLEFAIHRYFYFLDGAFVVLSAGAISRVLFDFDSSPESKDSVKPQSQ